MTNITLTVAIVASLLALTVRPVYAFVVYVAVALWYPKYLVVNLGTLDISAIRIVGVALVLRCLCSRQIRNQFTWSRLDTWVAISMAVYVGIYFITRPLSIALENRGGFLIDTWFAYMAARFCITTREGFVAVVKCVGILLAPLAILGVVEAFTGWQPYLALTQFCPWREGILTSEPRTGLNRAIGPFGHPIMFGACFAMFLPLVYSLRHEKNWQTAAYVLSGLALLGALSSMSNGPWIMLMVVIFCLAMERRKRWVKPLLKYFVLLCIGIEIISNRPFYHALLSRMTISGGSWWHRAKLIDLAIENIDEWWLAGYGGRDPGWGLYLGSDHSDITNQFILNGVEYGILGIIVLCVVFTVGFQGLIRTHRVTIDKELKSFSWALGCMLTAVMVSLLSTCYFSQMLCLFYCMLGIIGSVTRLSRQQVYVRNQIVLC